ncbi:MAG: ATPase, T2SS/T4P/T4SS family [Pseudomonadota bacterium]
MNRENLIIDQTLFDIKLNEAKLYEDQGLLEEADEVYKGLLKILGDASESKNSSTQKKQLEAIRAKMNASLGELVVDKNPSPAKKKSNQDLYLEAEAFTDLGYYEKAISIYKKLIKHNFKPYDCIYSIIFCNNKLENQKDAKEYLKTLVKDPQTNEKIRSISCYFLSFLYEEAGNYSKALALIGKITLPDELPDYENRKKFILSKIKGKTRFDYLLSENLISKSDLKKATDLSRNNRKSVEYNLLHSFSVKTADLGTSLATFYGYPFIDLSRETMIKSDLFKNLKYKYLKNNHWAPISSIPDEAVVEIAIEDSNMAHQEDIRKIYIGYQIRFFIAVREHIDEYIDRQYNKKDIDEAPEEDVFDFMDGISADIGAEYDEDDDNNMEDVVLVDSKVIMFVNKMLVDAYRKRASDIHIEPSTHTRDSTIRFRIDGICQPYVQIPNSFSRPIISRIKVMARMDITEHRKPLDGKIKFKSRSTGSIELRVTTIPTSGGKEDMVLRVLQSGKPTNLSDLGVYDYNLNRLLEIIKTPYGLILAVGPTGSGKTTTLHSALNIINTPEKKIWTAEDPIEIDQPGIRQAEVHPRIGLDFAALLRSFLRADPDVIMVGEMRDSETAKIGVEASLTGHLVFSTLHTNNAPGTVTRLLEMKIDPTNFADSLLGILAQRLGRKLCEKCKKKSDSPKEEFDNIINEFGPDPLGLLDEFKGKPIQLYHPNGCNVCNNTGYLGRIGFHELLINNDEIRRLIKTNASTDDIRAAAIRNNMYSLKQDGMIKVLKGITDPVEVRRNCI